MIRAATALFIMLGRVYIWPIDEYNSDLNLCINKAKSLLEVPEYTESVEFIDLIKQEITELESRLSREEQQSEKKSKNSWWKFW